MPGYQDTRSTQAQRTDLISRQSSGAGGPDFVKWFVLCGLGWLAMVAAVALGARVALWWWAADESRGMEASVQRFKQELDQDTARRREEMKTWPTPRPWR